MRAVTRRKYGPPELLTIREIQRPEPKANEILVRVRATTVNRTDTGILLGKPFLIRFFTGLRSPKSIVPGTDFAGDVEAAGAEVTDFKVGDRVWGFNDTGLASQAEYLTIRQDEAVCKIPDDIDYAQAAASAEGAHYAINFMKRAHFQPGQSVFVYGATGAIGSAAAQLVKAEGSHVTATCGTDYIERVRALGVDTVLDYQGLNLSTYPERFDLVFDAVGKSTFAACKPLLKPKGRYVSSELGPHAENLYLPLTTRLRSGPRVDFPIPTGSKSSISQMTEMLTAGTFRPLIDRHYSINDIRDAYDYVLSGQKIGNVIVNID